MNFGWKIEQKLGEIKPEQKQNADLVRRKDGRFRDKDLA